jgi:hypothetical protein
MKEMIEKSPESPCITLRVEAHDADELQNKLNRIAGRKGKRGRRKLDRKAKR